MSERYFARWFSPDSLRRVGHDRGIVAFDWFRTVIGPGDFGYVITLFYRDRSTLTGFPRGDVVQ